MADERHLSVLRKGAQAWNEWRKVNPEVQPDLRKADLREAKLSGADLRGALLIDADLHQACLKGANLERANLRRANLRQADFQKASLLRATLAHTDLREANLREADVREADLRDSHLPGALLDGADLKGAVLNKEGFRYVSMHNDKLSDSPTAPVAPVQAAVVAPALDTAADAAAKSRSLKVPLAVGVALLIAGFLGFWAFSPSEKADARVSHAIAEAIPEQSGVDSVEIEGQTLVLRSGNPKLENGMYLSLLKTACKALEGIEPPGELHAIRITNLAGDEGWVFDAPSQCANILTRPAALTSLAIAAHTRPIPK